jgi:hypothetical protein
MILTNEMILHYETRTNAHIQKVIYFAELIEDVMPITFSGLANACKKHDGSKFIEPEKIPYIWITWKYRCKDQNIPFSVPEVMEEKMVEATKHHILNNSHHPEFWLVNAEDGLENILNTKDRDKPPSKPLHCENMPIFYIGEMVADWFAMSFEKQTNPRDWFNLNVGKRWIFSNEATQIIDKLIKNVWEVRFDD